MIPRKIHYCWFGGKPLLDDVKKYIAGWRKYCPDYEIIEWNEKNFDINCNDYVREAYEAKKWAFVTDYVRLYALYRHGGIYMDTDVEVVRSFDDLLHCQAFMCFENDKSVSIGTLGAIKDSSLIKDFLTAYDNRHFLQSDGTYDTTTNLRIVTKILIERYGLLTNGKLQILGDIYVYPMEYFIAKSYRLGWIQSDENTYAIHHYAGSWVSSDEKEYGKSLRRYAARYMHYMENLAFRMAILRVAYDEKGCMGVLGKVMNKLQRKAKCIFGGGQKFI